LPGDVVHIDRNAKTLESFDPKFVQRPEAVEAWFYLWRITKDERYRRWGWEFFEALQRHSRVEFGFSGIKDASVAPSEKLEYDDVQQSFFLAETLKYLYLLFCPNEVLPLDEYVFNTEAHPLRVFSTKV